MLRNFFIVSLRNLIRHKTYSSVNILGLSVGLACSIVIGLWVIQEYNVDRQWKNIDRIYRVGVNFYNIGDMAIGPKVLVNQMSEYDGVEYLTDLEKTWGGTTIEVGNKELDVSDFYFTDRNFFRIFSYSFIQGDPENALDQPNSAVITAPAAKRLFGTVNVMGETFVNDNSTFTITGLVEETGKSHIGGEIWANLGMSEEDVNWTSASGYVYIKMKDGSTARDLDLILDQVLEEKVYPTISGGQPLEEWKSSGIYKFLPLPVQDIHLRSTLKYEPSVGGNIRTVQVFSLVGAMILLLACINFINISTARATVRAKEVGIRKSLGTNTVQLIFQFVFEAVMTCLIATLIAIGLAQLFLNGFERLLEVELLESVFVNVHSMIGILILALLIGVLAGIYPALYISRFQTIKVLKGNLKVREKGMLRSGLVVFQFTISISLLICAFFIIRQLNFMQKKDMGFDRENILVVRNYEFPPEKHQVFKQELQKLSQVQKVSKMLRVPASTTSAVTTIRQTLEEEQLYSQSFSGDEDMISTLGFRLLEGRGFKESIASDTSAVILNESAVKELGLEDPIGVTLNEGNLKVIGTVSDFNYETLKNKIGPAILRLSDQQNYVTAIKYSGSAPNEFVEQVRSIWAAITGEEELNYYFLDENFESLVKKEQTLANSLNVFTMLAMIISCLGLYGLSAFKAERNIKQIGIRKVLGASVFGISKRLSKQFALPIVYGFIVAAPTTYYIVREWLNNFAYRVNIDLWVFLVGGLIAFVIGIFTISMETIKAASRNPVNCLRDE